MIDSEVVAMSSWWFELGLISQKRGNGLLQPRCPRPVCLLTCGQRCVKQHWFLSGFGFMSEGSCHKPLEAFQCQVIHNIVSNLIYLENLFVVLL